MKKLLLSLCLFLSINNVSFASYDLLEHANNAYIKCHSLTGALIFEGNVKEFSTSWVNPGSSNDTNRIVSAVKASTLEE